MPQKSEELQRAQEERDRLIAEKTLTTSKWEVREEVFVTEIARLRKENTHLKREVDEAERNTTTVIVSTGFELDRMRMALEEIACGVSSDGAAGIAKRALNPQPAQPESDCNKQLDYEISEVNRGNHARNPHQK